MAIVEFGTIITAARGSIGGITLSANKSGPYAKLWAKGANQRSNLQTAQRNVISTHAQAWQGITAGQRTDWGTYAALAAQDLTNPLGETYSISGFLWFVRINSNRAQAGQTQLDAAPTIAVPAAPTIDAAWLKTDAAPDESHIDINRDDSTYLDRHVVTARLYNSEGRISGAFNLANIITAVPADPTQGILTLTCTAERTSFGAASNLVDGDTSTGWIANPPPPPCWIQGNIATADRQVTNYRWHSLDVGSVNDLPTAWVFQRWTGSAWSTIDTVTGYTPTNGVYHNFLIDTPSGSESDRWRMNMTAINGGASITLGEFEIYGYDPASHLKIAFQDELQTRLGTVQLGQKAFYECRVQTSEGRRGPAASATALAQAT